MLHQAKILKVNPMESKIDFLKDLDQTRPESFFGAYKLTEGVMIRSIGQANIKRWVFEVLSLYIIINQYAIMAYRTNYPTAWWPYFVDLAESVVGENYESVGRAFRLSSTVRPSNPAIIW